LAELGRDAYVPIEPKYSIEELKHLLWDCHYIITYLGEPDSAADLIVEKLNPEALKCRLKPPTGEWDEPEPSGELVKELRNAWNEFLTTPDNDKKGSWR